MPLLPITPTTPRPWRAIVSNSMPAKPKAPSPSSRQTWRSGWATLAPIAWPGPGAEAAERARVHPAARLVGLDVAAGVGDEVAAVADHDRVAVEHLARAPCRRGPGAAASGRRSAPPARPRASPPRPRAAAPSQAAVRSRPPPAASRIAARLAATSPTRSTSGARLAVSALGAGVEADQLRLLAEAAAEAEPEVDRHADHQRDVGPLEPGAAGAAEGELVVGGQAAAAEAVEEDRDPERLGQRPQLLLAAGPSRGRCRP